MEKDIAEEEEEEAKQAETTDEQTAVPSDLNSTPAIVTANRKQELLLQARAARVAWIHSVPLPYVSDHQGESLLEASHVGQHVPCLSSVLSTLYDKEVNVSYRISELLQETTKEDRERAIPTGSQILSAELKRDNRPYPEILDSYQAFLVELQKPEYTTLVQGMRRFIQNLSGDDKEVLATSIRSYTESTMEMRKLKAGSGDADKDALVETRRALESFLFGHAQEAIWKALKEDTAKDADCLERLKSLGFMTPQHLEIACLANETADDLTQLLDEPVYALNSIDAFFSPFEKLQRILKVYSSVNDALSRALNRDNEDPTENALPSADDVLPTFILALIKARPSNIVSNLRMIEVYAAPEYLRGEAGYAFTNLYGALQFLLDLNLEDSVSPENLSISAEDFREGLKECRAAAQAKVEAQAERAKTPTTDIEAPMPRQLAEIPVEEIRAARLRGEEVNLDWARKWQEENGVVLPPAGEGSAEDQDMEPPLPDGFSRSYTFLNTRPEEVRVSDLAQLLSEYRMLVNTTESLLAERSNRIAKDRKERLSAAQEQLELSALEADLNLMRRKRSKSKDL